MIELNEQQKAIVYTESPKVIVAAGAGSGKAQPDYTEIPTPDGIKKLKELKIGDKVFDRQGNETEVKGIFPQGMKRIYEIELADGRIAECCEEHLWSYDNGHNGLTTKSLKKMYEHGWRKKDKRGHNKYIYRIPELRKPVYFKEKPLPIDPYVFGCFLGDGCCTEPYLTISSNDEELVQENAKLIDCLYSKRSEFNFSWGFKTKLGKCIKTKEFFNNYQNNICCLCGEKSIPEDYLYSSIEQRYSLLQGLMDTDGYIGNARHSPIFSTTSLQLAKDVRFLAQSLGYPSKIHTFNRKDKKNIEYEVTIFTSAQEVYKIFRLSRKRDKALSFIEYKNRINHNFISIIDIRPTDRYTEMRCILVDNSEHLYLTNDFIVTHNTTVLIERIKFLLSQGYEGKNIYAITYTNAAAEEMKSRLPNDNPIFAGTIHSLANRILLQNNIDTSWMIQSENFDELFYTLQDHYDEINIPQVDYLLIDEFQDICDNEYEFMFNTLNPKEFMAVGDSCQSIYGFKGSNYHYFMNMVNDPDIQLYNLNWNYRCGSSIIDFAENFLYPINDIYMVHNESQTGLKGAVQTFEFSLDTVLNEVQDYFYNYKDIFVLTRTNKEISEVQFVLNKYNIPNDTFKKSDLDKGELGILLEKDSVKILTVHSAKGLEAKKVIVLGMKPYNNEERRVCYVAATRAKEELIWLTNKKQKKQKMISWG